MKVQVHMVTERTLDLLVAIAEGYRFGPVVDTEQALAVQLPDGQLSFITGRAIDWIQHGHWSPSTEWAQGGPIVDKMKMEFTREGESMRATIQQGNGDFQNDALISAVGTTHLQAAMRCHALARLGPEFDLEESIWALLHRRRAGPQLKAV